MRPSRTALLAVLGLASLPATARDYTTVSWDESHGVYGSYTLDGQYADLLSLLEGAGFSVAEGTLDTTDLDETGVLVAHITGAYSSAYTTDDADLLELFVEDGGGLLILCDNSSAWPTNIQPLADTWGVDCGGVGTSDGTVFASHPVTDGLSTVDVGASGALTHDSFTTAIIEDSSGYVLAVLAEHGDGRVAIVGDVNVFDTSKIGGGYSNDLFAEQLFDWLSFGLGEDAVIDSDDDGWADDVDCAPDDPDIHPEATEVCDGVDNDCDELVDDADDSVDEGGFGTWYRDGDEDGFGSAAVSACDQPEGTVDNDDDCDDDTAAVNPDATEICDGIDNDCDSLVDDDDDSVDESGFGTWYVDGDEDGFGSAAVSACDQPEGTVDNDDDCDDDAVAVNPDATEICDDIDNDCDSRVDDDDDSTDLSTGGTWYADSDFDGFGDPGAATTACEQPADTVEDATDCDDGDSAVNPDAAEICDDVDNDCDALFDGDDDSVDLSTGLTFYADTDEDGFGDPLTGLDACTTPEGFVADASDCDDTDPAVHPDATEICNEVDDDCDGLADDDDDSVDLSTGGTWYGDADEDDFGAPDAPVMACVQPDGTVDDDTDCDDSNGDIYPGAPEIADDGIDQDCDGSDVTSGGDDSGGGDGDGGTDGDGGDDTGTDGDKDEGCGSCSTGTPGGGLAAIGLLLLGLVRRRRD